MSHEERDLVLLREVLDLIDLTTANVPNNKEAFMHDLNARDATALRVQAIGEHMRSLSEVFREQHSELPWRQSIAMRNIVAHEYGNLDYEIVWEVVTGNDFASFRELVLKILK
ncbi:MAG TPA: HepT-like ribonuclease domain-containing protein [Candidatus Saccharimonadales bacterium]|nr:HepT-like ribonuclease domain-containing protein [Candidatus Saccharimonadales bacterium]